MTDDKNREKESELTGNMIQIKNAEKLPKNAITFPNPGKSIAVITHIPVVIILDPTLKIAFIFSPVFNLFNSTSASASSWGPVKI